jgi:hypothetical protein
MAQRKSERDKELRDNAHLLRAWKAFHREEREAVLAGPHAAVVAPLMELLDTLTLQSGKELLNYIRAQDWHAIDARTKLVVLHEINKAICKVRERAGKPPIDDALWGEPATVFQAIRLIVIPFEGKPAEVFSAPPAGRISSQ